jgi:hypothetical protein
MEGIRKAMNERNLKEGQWEDRKQWSLGVGQRRKTFRNLHIRSNNKPCFCSSQVSNSIYYIRIYIYICNLSPLYELDEVTYVKWEGKASY